MHFLKCWWRRRLADQDEVHPVRARNRKRLPRLRLTCAVLLFPAVDFDDVCYSADRLLPSSSTYDIKIVARAEEREVGPPTYEVSAQQSILQFTIPRHAVMRVGLPGIQASRNVVRSVVTQKSRSDHCACQAKSQAFDYGGERGAPILDLGIMTTKVDLTN
jgi:hypothetical protein